jgi:nucleoside-diphosphate-sugar epimerase
VVARRGPIRSGRSDPLGTSVIAVTGTAGAAHAAVVRALAERVGEPGGPGRVIAVEAEVGPALEGASGPTASPDLTAPSDLTALAELTAPSTLTALADLTVSADLTVGASVTRALRGSDVVVHVATPTDLAADLALGAVGRRARAVRAVQEVAGAAAAVGARRLVVVTSATVYGARADNPVPLPADAPLRAEPDDGVVGDLLEVERIAARTPRLYPGLAVTVLRPAALVGPGVDTVITRHFAAPRLLSLRGGGMRWQFLHVEDLGRAVAVAVEHDLDGVLTAGSAGWLSAGEVARRTGMRRIELPTQLAYGTAERLHRAGVLPPPAADLAMVVHPWVVGSQRLLEAGWEPQHDCADCLTVLVNELQARRPTARRVEPREAALGTAGAAVAIVGTAALLRQARARRRRGRRPTL